MANINQRCRTQQLTVLTYSAGKCSPQLERDQRLLQTSQEVFETATDDVDVTHQRLYVKSCRPASNSLTHSLTQHQQRILGGFVAEWLACWTQAQSGTHPSCLCSPSSKIVAALLRVAGVTAGPAESNGSLPPGL